MNKETINEKKLHDICLNFTAKDSFIVNNRYDCRFDFAKQTSNASLFSKWLPNESAFQRYECEANVNVYDLDKRQHLIGKIALAINKDLTTYENIYSAAIYVKNHDSTSWQSCTNITTISNIRHMN